MATVAELGARALKKLGLSPVAVADRPSTGSTVTVTTIANRALRMLGVNPIAEAEAASNSGTVTVAVIATSVLRRLGLNPYDESAVPANAGTTDLPDIAERALRRLGIVAAEETPETADQTLAEEKAGAVHEHLLALNYAVWADDEIPASVAEHYVAMAAVVLAPSFGIVGQQAEYEAARSGVRVLAYSGSYGQTLAETKISRVHEMLAAGNLVSWASSAIPTWAADPYAQMAAAWLAPEVGAQPDQAAFEAGMAVVRAMTLTGSAGQTRAETEVHAAHQTLNAMGFVTWTTSAIPEPLAEHYAVMAAAYLAPVYGKPRDDAGYANAVTLIRRFAYGGAIGQAIAEQKIRAVQASLSARGISRWTLASIPDYAQEPIVMMAAAWLAPDIGEAAPPTLYIEGEREIRRVTSLGTGHGTLEQVYY